MAKNRLYPLIFVFIAFCVVFYFYHKYRMAPTIDIKQLEIVDENGNAFDVNSLKGKKLVVSFYASWCGNCVKELMEINKIINTELKDVQIVCITDESLEKLHNFKNKSGYPFLFLKLKKQFPDIGINSIPVTYIVNQNLEVQEEYLGYIQWDDPSTVNHIKSLY